MNSGYIKTYRKLLEWEWYTDSNVKDLFIHCLLKANHTEKKWKGMKIDRGSFVTSYAKLKLELNISVQQIRTALKKLKSTGEITSKSTSNYTVISINNYDYYQDNNKQPNKRATNEQQTSNKRITTTNKLKNEKNDKNNINKETITSILKQFDEPLRTTLKEFVEFRKGIKAKMTPRALKLLLNKLDELAKDDETKIKILEQSIMNGWKSVFPLKNNKSYRNDREVSTPAWMNEQHKKEKKADIEEARKLLEEFK